jgi:hypothetical protein
MKERQGKDANKRKGNKTKGEKKRERGRDARITTMKTIALSKGVRPLGTSVVPEPLTSLGSRYRYSYTKVEQKSATSQPPDKLQLLV